MSDGYLVYAGASASGGTLLHRALPAGLEDYLSFDARPRRASVSYTFTPGEAVKGLRLVANTLELVDAGGAPRLRVEPPSIVGADGVRTSAALAVEGCAVDHSPAAPWGRAPTRPGHERCGLRVSWPAQGIAYPAILDPRWTSTMTMNAKRQGHTATLLTTGKVLVVGGTDGTNALNTAELFDPATATWTPTATFTGARQLHTAVQLGTNANATTSGKVLVAGGWSGGTTTSGAAVNTALLYTVATGAWTAATNLNAVRAMHTATILPSGQVLVAGGMSDTATVLNTAALYDPTTGAGKWTATGTMAIKARFHTATLMPTTGPFANKVVVVGGNTGGTTSMAVVQLFSGTTWTSAGIAQLPGAREGHTATLLANGNLLVTGGKAGSAAQSSTLLFNAATAPGTWASAGTMKATHAGHTATLLSTSILSTGQVLVAGGAPTTTNSAEVWDGATTWTPTTPLPSIIAGHTATLLNSKLVLIAGGISAAGASAAQLYDPSFGLVCTTNSQCGTGFCVSGVCCDTACNSGCGVCNLTGKIGTCSPAASATVCRAAAAGGCDVAETCNGTSLTCPTDAFAANTVTCRAAVAGGCDVAEKCTGTSAACPADAFAASTVTCRAANGACDVAEKCTGTSSACPADGFAASTTVCRPANGACDVAETCTGMSPSCPVDAFLSNTTVCRAARGACDVAETCTGTSDACPADGFAGPTVVCRYSNGPCDAPESCGGSSPSCPVDGNQPDGTLCDDSQKCTKNDHCTNGACSGTQVVCAAPDQCHLAGSCNMQTGTCALPEKPNGTVCDDGNPSTSGETCEVGVCRTPASYQAASAFMPEDLGTLGGSITNPTAINGYGQIVGNATSADGVEHGFTWSANQAIEDLGAAPGFPATGIAIDVKDDGSIAGTITEPSGSHHAFRYALSTILDLGPIGDEQPDEFGNRGSYVTAENAAGDLTGYYTNAGDVHTFRYTQANGSLFDVGGIYGRQTIGYDISDAGSIVGVSWVPNALQGGIRQLGHAFLSDADYPGDYDLNDFIDPTSGWTLVNAKSISPNGTYIVGSGDLGGQLRAYRFNRTTGVIDDLSTAWTGDVFPYAVNDEGKVAGTGFPTPSASLTGWIYTDQVGFQNLNDVVGSASGWTVSVATAINAAGDLTGYGTYQGSLTRGFRLRMGTACPSSCPASDQCHVGACDPTTGACTNVAKPNGATCDDGLASTSGETCEAGLCRAPSSYPSVSNLAVDDLGDLGGHYSIAGDINSFGVVVGDSTAANGTNQAFIWSSPGPMADLGAESSFLAYSGASAINDAGMVVGETTDGTNGEHVYRFTETNFVEDLGVVGDNSVSTTDVFNFQGAAASDVNESGDLSGYFSMNGQTHGFRYSNGAFDDIGSLHGGLTYAWGIDEAGDVVGSSWVPNSVADYTARRLGHAIMWNQILSDPVDLNEYVEPSSGWVLHSASDISDNGRYIVGTGEINGILRAFRLDTTTGTIAEVSNFPGDAYGEAVNNNGDVAGTGHLDAANATQAGFIYTDQLGFRKLNDIIDPASGWNIEVINGINEAGDVVGWGDYQGQRPRAVRVHQIVTPQVACLGKQEGDSCDSGNSCGANNVCHVGVCGGGDPSNVVCLRADGIVDVGSGYYVAIFGYDSPMDVIPTVNQVRLDGAVVEDPAPPPPAWLSRGSWAGAYQPAFATGHEISWTIEGQKVAASLHESPLLTKQTDANGDYVMIDGSRVTLRSADVPSLACLGKRQGDACNSGMTCSADGHCVSDSSISLSTQGWIATASSSQGGDVPGNAIDGNEATRWSSGVPQTGTDWFQVDMLAPNKFSRLTLDTRGSPTDYARAYEVFVSNDGANWGTPVASGVGTSDYFDILFPAATARYFRIAEKGSTENWWSIHELKVALAPTIVPSVAGITTINGTRVAVFSYDNQTGQNQNIPVGPENSLAGNTAVIDNDPISNLPPTLFLPGPHAGAFIAEMANSQVTWNLAGTSATADLSTNLTVLSSSTAPDGVRVTIDGTPTLVLPNNTELELGGIVPRVGINGLTPGTLAGHLDASPDGAATYNVPIWTPNAPVKPTISLSYDSRVGNSYIGTGFSISGLNTITRCKTGFSEEKALERRSINLNSSDHLCLDGKLLVATKGEEWNNGTEYRPEGDPFTLVRAHMLPVSDVSFYVDSFDVYRRDGFIETYGGADDAVLTGTNGDLRTQRVAWALKKVTDHSNNTMTYTYYTAERGGLALIPKEIDYGSAGPNAGLYSYAVGFSVEPMPQADSVYEAGMQFPLTHRLTGITIAGPSPTTRSVVKAYKLTYDDARPMTKRFVVSTIQECDGVGDASTGTVCKPPTTFGWEPGKLEFQEGEDIVFNEVRRLGDADNRGPAPYYAATTADLDGDGRDDYVYRGIDPSCPGLQPNAPFVENPGPCTQLVLYYRLAAENFATAHPISTHTGVPLLQPTAFFTEPSPILRNFLAADIDGDGKSEVVFDRIYSPATNGETPLQFFTKGVADVNGDGLPDIVNPDDLNDFIPSSNGAFDVVWPAFGFVSAYANLLSQANAFQLAAAYTPLPNYRTVAYALDNLNVVPNRPGGSIPEFLDVNGDGATDILVETGRSMAALSPLLDLSTTVTQLTGNPTDQFGGMTGFQNLTGLVSPGLGVPGMSPGIGSTQDWPECFQGTPPDGDACWSGRYATHVPLDINGDGLTDVIEFMSLSEDDSDLRNGGVWGPIEDVGGGWETFQPVVKINEGGVMNKFMTGPSQTVTLNQPYIFNRVEPSKTSPLYHLRRTSFAMHLFPVETTLWLVPVFTNAVPNGMDVAGDPGLRTADFNEDGRDDLISFSPLVAEKDNTAQPLYWINAMMLLSTGTDFADPVPIPTSSHPDPTATEAPSRDRPLATDPLSMNASVQPWGLASPGWTPLRVWDRGNILTGSPDTSLDRASYSMTKILDADGDGQPDFISPVSEQNGRPVFHVFLHEGKRPDLLTSVTNGLGAEDDVTYKPMIDPSVYTPTASSDTTCRYPLKCVKGGLWLVSKIARDNGIAAGSRSYLEYQYADGRLDMRGGGWLGFASVTVTDDTTQAVTTTSYDSFTSFDYHNRDGTTRTTYPKAFLPSTITTTYLVDNFLQKKTINTYVAEIVPFSNGGVQLVTLGGVRPDTDSDEVWDTNPLGLSALKSRHKRQYTDYDDHANPQTVVDTTEQGVGGTDPNATTTTDTITHTRTFDNDETNWLLGLQKTEHVDAVGSNGDEAIQDLAYTYFPQTNLVQTITRDKLGGPATFLLTTLERNAHGLVTSTTDTDATGLSRQTSVTYENTVGLFPETVTRGPLTYTTIHHPTYGVVLRSGDPNGVGTTTTFDTFARPQDVTPDAGGTSIYTYSSISSGTLVTVQTDGQPTVATLYDRVGLPRARRTQALDGSTVAVFTDYDGEGRVTQRSRPVESTSDLTPPSLAAYQFSQYTWDNANRLIQVIYPGTSAQPGTGTSPPVPASPGGMATTTYAWLTAFSAQNNSAYDGFNGVAPKLQTSMSYDGAGRPSVSAVIKSDGTQAKTSFSYGAFGRPGTITDALGNVVSMDYDAWNRRRHLTDPDMGTTETIYDAFGEPIQELTERGTANYEYDPIGRPMGGTGPDGASFVTWDSAPYGVGKPAAALSPDDVLSSWQYDNFGRPTSETAVVEGVTISLGREYDARNRLLAIDFPGLTGDPVRVQYGYSDVSGYLNGVTSPDPSLSWSLLEDMPDGQLKREDFGGGAESTRSYQDNGFLTGMETHKGDTEMLQTSYVFDGLGRLKQRDAETYDYDDFSRLKTWTHNSTGGPWTETYDYDDIGNMKTHTGVSPTNGYYINDAFNYGENGKGPHALTSGTTGSFDYDSLGNQTVAPGRTLDFNTFSLPRTMTKDGVTTTFKYDFFHHRVLKRNTAGSTTVSLGGIYELRIESGLATFVLSVPGAKSTPVAQIFIDSGGNRTVQYVHDDHLGSPQLLTDGNGSSTGVLTFDPWGNRIVFDSPGGGPQITTSVPPGLRLGFTGHNHDDELGLIDMNGRLYDPNQRRFISPDPFVQNPLDGQSYNRYAYVFNDPLNMVDPTGYDGDSDGDDPDYQVQPVSSAPPGSTASRGIPFDTPNGDSSSGRGGRNGRSRGQGQASTPTPRSGPASTGSGDSQVATPSTGTSPTGQPGGQPGANSGNGTGTGPGGPPGPGPDMPGPSEPGPSVGGYNPTGSTAPNAAPNGVANPNLNWIGHVFERYLPGVTMNPDTRDEIEGASILFGVLAPLIGPLMELTEVEEALTARMGDIGTDEEGTNLVIGRGRTLDGPGELRANESRLSWDSKLPDWNAEWHENAGRLRSVMREGRPIRDASPGDTGGRFLNAERNLLIDRGWTFDSQSSYWFPPSH